jgi:hypothetical protein
MNAKHFLLLLATCLMGQGVAAAPRSDALSAPDGGFSSQDLSAASQAGLVDRSTRNSRIALAQTERLRALFVRDPRQAWASLSPDESALLARVLDPGTPVRDLAISWLMRNGAAQSSTLDGGKFTGLYSSLADVWLLLRWAEVGGAWRIVDARLLPAKALLEETAEEPGSSGTPQSGFVQSYRDALARFSALVSDQTPTSIMNRRNAARAQDQALAHRQIDVWLASLKSLYELPGPAATLDALPAQLVAQAQDEGSNLDLLPISGLQTFIPLGVLSQDTGRSVLLGSPFYPTVLIRADYRDVELKQTPSFSLIQLSLPSATPAGDRS